MQNVGVALGLWRGSLLPLGCEAPPKDGTAAQSSGSKLPRHKVGVTSATGLLGRPRVKALLQLLTVIRPEAHVDLHLVGDVFRGSRHVLQDVLRQQRYGLGIGGAVGDVFRVGLLLLRL